MMNKSNIFITIDNGNTNPHVGVFIDGILQEILSYASFLENYQRQLDDVRGAISSVGKNKKWPLKKENIISFKQHFKNNIFRDMPINYSQQIGDDRLLSAYYIFKQHAKKFQKNRLDSILLLDIGTFGTADIIDQEGMQGGIIFPGEATFFNSYQQNSSLLPALKKTDLNLDQSFTLGKNTQQAIINAAKLYFKGLYLELKRELNPQLIIITGGSAHSHFELINSAFNKSQIIVEPDLIHHAIYFNAHISIDK